MVRFPDLMRFATLLLCALPCGPAVALGLLEAFQEALRHDPTYLSAVYENEAGQQLRAVTRAGLLPTVSAQITANKNNAERTTSNVFGAVTTEPDYTSRVAAISLRQPLINWDGWARYKQGEAQARLSEAQFSVRTQELLLRVTTAYLAALLAEDQLEMATAQRETLAEQSRVNMLTFQKGEGTRTDMLETQARLDLAEAQLIEAEDRLAAARSTLNSMVGREIEKLSPLASDSHIRHIDNRSFEEWKTLALAHNPQVAAQRHTVEVAAREVERARAGHAPRLDLVASYSSANAETITTFNQSSKVGSVGVQLNIPLYAGGQVSALAAQAVANHNRAKADLESTEDKTVIELERQYRLIQSGIGRIRALEKAVESARLLVTATQQSIKGGLRINLDVLNARQQLFAAQSDLAHARYSYLLTHLQLRASAGVIAPDDLLYVASYLAAP